MVWVTVKLVWITASLTQPVQAQTEPRLQVVTWIDAPWGIRQGDNLTGFHAELWKAIAGEIGVDYEFTVVEHWDDMLKAVAAGTADLAVQHIFINFEREQISDFTHAVFDNGLQILVRSTWNLRSLLGPLATLTFWRFIAAGLGIVLIVAHLQWLCERHRPDSDFHRTYLRGIWDGLWWAVVTFTTAGYGDYVPKSARGRAIAVVWMFLSLFLVSLFVAEFSAVFTVRQIDDTIDSFDDLPGRRVATWSSSVPYEILRSIGVTPVTYHTTTDIVDSLDRGDVEAAVLDSGSATGVDHTLRLQIDGRVSGNDDALTCRN